MIGDDDMDDKMPVDLHRWHVPPPPVGQRHAILERALATPPAPPPRQRRLVGILIGFGVANAAVAAIVALLLVRPAPANAPVVPAGPIEDRVQEIQELRRRVVELTEVTRRQQREIEERVAALREMERRITELRASVDELSERRRRKTPAPASGGACDEVTCLLDRDASPCCARVRPTTRGHLVAYTKPYARLFIDGKDTHRSTPITPREWIPLAPGRHTVTFDVDGRRYTYPINVAPGEVVRMTKDLGQPGRP